MMDERVSVFKALVLNEHRYPEGVVHLHILTMYRQYFLGYPELARAAKEVVAEHRSDWVPLLEESDE